MPITVHAPDATNANRWARSIEQLVTAEFGDSMRLTTSVTPDAELGGDEARAEVDRLATELYRAQDALLYAREMCDQADRTGTPVTTDRVRTWLEGAKCGRQIMAERGRSITEVAAGADCGHDAERHGPESGCIECRCPTTTGHDRDDGLREAIATAIDGVFERWATGLGDQRPQDALTTAVLAVVQPVIDQLTRDRDLAIAHDRQPYPTAWAYEQACKALETHRGRAEQAEEHRRALADVLGEPRGRDWATLIGRAESIAATTADERTRAGTAEARVAAALALHAETGWGVCAHCTGVDAVAYPCATVTALTAPGDTAGDGGGK